MNYVKVVTACIFILAFVPLQALEPVPVDSSFQKQTIGTYIEYIEDTENKLTFDDILKTTSWISSTSESFSFGFTKSVYWFRFSIANKSPDKMNHFFEITYPLLNFVEFYKPQNDGYTVIKTGNKYPFYDRDIIDKNFVFQIDQNPGLKTYYLRIETTSSINFVPVLMNQRSYLQRHNTQTPIIWLYYGLMLIMFIYNMLIFMASRDRNYLYYVAFIASYILFQMTLNGYSFQYLWPNALWWGSNSLPFFICTSVFTASIFMRNIMEFPVYFKTMDKIILYGVMIPSGIWSLGSLIAPYSLAIKIATGLIGILATILILLSLIAAFKGSRAGRIVSVAFICLVIGIVLYVLKTFGILPKLFITEWAIQIGSSLVIVFLSLSLADKINVMRSDLSKLVQEQEQIKVEAQERAAYLEGIVGTATGLTEEFVRVSGELQTITNRFSDLSMEQASTSEEMSSTFEELYSSVETIYHATITQKDEGEKSTQLVGELNEAQKELLQETQKVDETINEILKSSNVTGNNLRQMNDTMTLINTGGKEISQFIAMIDDISDRINLLSLNAAIEAARAGEYGRGFAVVADEIGKLAQATSENSKQIANQISTIISDIEKGSSIVANAKESTDIILDMVDSLNTGIGAVREMMMKQNQALEMVIKQSSVIDTMSKDIVIATNEQKDSMAHTQTVIERLSEMAQEIAHANNTIIDFSKVILEKAEELDKVIRHSGQ